MFRLVRRNEFFRNQILCQQALLNSSWFKCFLYSNFYLFQTQQLNLQLSVSVNILMLYYCFSWFYYLWFHTRLYDVFFLKTVRYTDINFWLMGCYENITFFKSVTFLWKYSGTAWSSVIFCDPHHTQNCMICYLKYF